MAVVDMPLEELRGYMGKNPCPGDFDQYWADGLAEMRAIDANVEIVAADFKSNFADCYHLYFTGVGGSRIHAKLLKPKNISGKAPAILEFHGYTGQSGDWVNKLPFAASGCVVASLDCRGQGGLSEDLGSPKGNTHHGHIIRGLADSPEKMLYRQIYLDTAQMAKIVMEMDDVDETRVGAMGGSQGGGLTLACASLVPEIKKAAPTFPFLCDYQRVWEMDLCTGAYIEIRDYFRRFDPLHEREAEMFTQLGYIDIQHMVKNIKAEVLMAVTMRDDICPPSTQFAAYNKISSKKEAIIYPDFGHEGLPGWPDRVFEFVTDI